MDTALLFSLYDDSHHNKPIALSKEHLKTVTVHFLGLIDKLVGFDLNFLFFTKILYQNCEFLEGFTSESFSLTFVLCTSS